MDISGRFDNFFADKDERQARKDTTLQTLRTECQSQAEDYAKAAKRTGEAFIAMKQACGSDADLVELINAVKGHIVCPF